MSKSQQSQTLILLARDHSVFGRHEATQWYFEQLLRSTSKTLEPINQVVT